MQIAEHGGALGIRDRGLLESALARPEQHATLRGANDDVPLLSAMSAIALSHNHPFVDGNKRVAFVALETFLNLSGFQFSASDESCVVQMLALASGESSDDAFIEWVRKNATRKRSK
jgi:death-on-curing protein